ncbi:Uncharacterized protein APZ42_008747, partial [Daphnia magna]
DKTKRFCDRHLSESGKFHKTPEQYAAWLKIKQKFRPVFSWFKGCNPTIYNFHPECVNTNLDADGNVIELVKLCPVCSSCADNVEQSFPRYSIANGIDYGVFFRLSWLKPLSLTEEHAISLTRPYGCIVKLSGFNCAERQSAKKGHFIFFRQAQAAQQMADATKPDRLRVLPDVSDIKKYIAITFIGADQTLQAVHPSSASIIIDDSQPIANQLNSVIHKLILNAEILSSDIEINIDKVATERPANKPIAGDEINNEPLPTTETSGNTSASTIPSTFEEEETHPPNFSNEIEPMEMHSSFLTQRDPRQKNDKEQKCGGLHETLTNSGQPHRASTFMQEQGEERLTNEEGLPIIAVTEPLFKIPLEPPTIQGI